MSTTARGFGVTVILVSTAWMTVTVADPTWPPKLACTWAVPTASAVARPFRPDAFETETAAVDDDQVAETVKSAVLLSA